MADVALHPGARLRYTANMNGEHEEKPPNHVRRRKMKYRGLFVSLGLIGLAVIGLFFVDLVTSNMIMPEAPIKLGATFSKPYAESLGLDWKQAYTAVLDDLKAHYVRIPAYWPDIEPEPGVYNFKNVDWQVTEAGKRGAQVVLAVGRKLPRWPECWVPEWAKGMDTNLLKSRILSMVEAVVRHYADSPYIIIWQVENEPFFEFGDCPPPDRDLLKEEIGIVRALDRRPVMVTESGELSTWINAASLADILGLSTYRIVWSKYVGYFYWPITPLTYAQRAATVRSFVDDIIISELQAEPWVQQPLTSLSYADQMVLMNPQRLRDNVEFARKIGFSSAYFWGVEWWYWLKVHGHPEMWQAGKQIFMENSSNGSQK